MRSPQAWRTVFYQRSESQKNCITNFFFFYFNWLIFDKGGKNLWLPTKCKSSSIRSYCGNQVSSVYPFPKKKEEEPCRAKRKRNTLVQQFWRVTRRRKSILRTVRFPNESRDLKLKPAEKPSTQSYTSEQKYICISLIPLLCWFTCLFYIFVRHLFVNVYLFLFLYSSTHVEAGISCTKWLWNHRPDPAINAF